jgi:hypothetical protein
MADELATVSAERTALIERQNDARTLIARGVGLLVAMPVVILVAGMIYAVLGGVAAMVTVLVGALCALICTVAGIATMVVGGVQYRRLAAQIHDWPRLPEARVVERRLPAGDESQ